MKKNPGDQLAGIAATSERERVAAKSALADMPLLELLNNPVISPETDEVTRLILESHDASAFQRIRSMTVGAFRELILNDRTAEADLKSLKWGITPEMAAAVAKLMSNKDLVLAASKIRNVTRCRNTMGERGVLGIRLQPNHPSDTGGGSGWLPTACCTVVRCRIGVNPATDSVEAVAAILSALESLIKVLAFRRRRVARAHHHPVDVPGSRRSCRFVVSVCRRNPGSQCQLRYQSWHAARRPRARSGTSS
jgi:ethanolamine ammonia-lyase large subunit